MKIISWNVNGIRAVLNKGFPDFVKQENPDIICLQEIKAYPHQVEKILPGYGHQIWNPAQKPGYSGTAIFSKIAPLAVEFGKEHFKDEEGRVIVAEFEEFFLVNVYTPNSQRELTRLSHRQEWDKKFLHHLQQLEQRKPVVFCGDLNVAHTEKDIARPKDNVNNAGFTAEERAGFQKFVDSGFIDSFREFNPSPGNYTWWSYMFNARARNIGWRLDYFLLSQKMKTKLQDAFILPQVLGSDHCPVGILLK